MLKGYTLKSYDTDSIFDESGSLSRSFEGSVMES